MNKENFNAVVCPKQKVVKIFERAGKHGKSKLLKTYRFKMDIPKVQKVIEVEHYDYGAWSVSERGWTEEKIITCYDENIINSIRERAIQWYTTPTKNIK